MRLSDVCEINPRSQAISDDTLVSFVAMPDVSEDGKINTSVVRSYGEVKKGYTVFREGDILFAKITPCMENGKGALAVGLQNGIGVGSTEFHVLRPNTDLIDEMWLYYLTAWRAFRHEAEIHMTGSAGQKRVPKAFLENYQVEIPPLNEQKCQVVQLDRIRNVIEARQHQLRTLDTLIKARFVEMFGDVKQEDTLLNLCNIIDYRGKTPEKVDDGLPFITAKNVRMHQLSIEPREYISKETYDSVMTRGLPREGDVVFTTEAPLGNVCRLPHFDTEFYVGQRIVTLQTERLVPAYLEYALDTDEFRRKVDGKSSGSTVTGIRVRLLEQLTIPVPNRASQDQFASFVSQIDKSKAIIQSALQKTQTLFDSLMQQYFG